MLAIEAFRGKFHIAIRKFNEKNQSFRLPCCGAATCRSCASGAGMTAFPASNPLPHQGTRLSDELPDSELFVLRGVNARTVPEGAAKRLSRTPGDGGTKNVIHPLVQEVRRIAPPKPNPADASRFNGKIRMLLAHRPEIRRSHPSSTAAALAGRSFNVNRDDEFVQKRIRVLRLIFLADS